MKTKLLLLVLCLCAGLAMGLPKKKNKNKAVSNSVAEEDSDLIPIPDHLLDDYKHSGKIQSKINQAGCKQADRVS